MNMKNLAICLTLAVLLGSTGMSWGADYEKGHTVSMSVVTTGWPFNPIFPRTDTSPYSFG